MPTSHLCKPGALSALQPRLASLACACGMRERARPPAARLLTGAAARARRGLRTGEQAKAVRALERAGAAVAVSTLDVVDAGEAAALLALAGRAAPVAAVFHLAMYLDDRLLASQARAPCRCWVARAGVCCLCPRTRAAASGRPGARAAGAGVPPGIL